MKQKIRNFSLLVSKVHLTKIKIHVKTAFTLAEILITLVIIGVVAVLTIPALIKNHNEKTWATARSVFEKRLEVATKQMNAEEKLAGYSGTMEFVNELKKYIKITRVCDNSEITKCFEREVIWNDETPTIDMTQIKTAATLGQTDWNTDTVAVQFANGVNAIIAYNPNTIQEPYNNQFNATSNSMAILYDVSGNKNPNKNGKDVWNINVTELAGTTGCIIPEDVLGFCITQIISSSGGYTPLSKTECEELKDELGIKICYSNSDYWAGAVKACGGVDRLPTMEQLGLLATYLFNYPSQIGPYDIIYQTRLTLDKEKAAPFIEASYDGNIIWLWSGEETNYYYSQACTYSTATRGQSYSRYLDGFAAVCIKN